MRGECAIHAIRPSRVDSEATTLISAAGRSLFSLAIIALGVETLVLARTVGHSLGTQYDTISALPWLPAIPWDAYLFGVVWIVCGAGLLFGSTRRMAAMTLGSLLFLCTLLLDVPKNAADIGSISLRTIVFEPLSLACLAWLVAGSMTPGWLVRGSRRLLGASLIVFGVDHFLALAFIATLIPGWIPWHVFWVAFFGVGLIAAGLSIGLNLVLRWGAAGIGSMFGIWVLTLHVPRVLGWYGIPGAPRDPEEWSSLFIAVALWGGLTALGGTESE
jgi:uncharacterized membrane protein